MQAQHDQLTLIVVGGETSPVRRIELPRRRIRQAIGVLVVLAVVGVAGIVDWVRLRIDAVDVDALRAETVHHQSQIAELEGEVGRLQGAFDEMGELERKVRVIANLPGAVTEAQIPAGTLGGQGGGDETDTPTDGARPEAAPPPPPPAPAPQAANAVHGDLDTAALARVQRKARALARQVPDRMESFSDLLSGLKGKSDQLASTPSIWPTDGWVTSRYGYRTSPFTGRRQFHPGIDIATAFGTPIVAPARGRVAYVGMKGALGRCVIIDHGYGLRTFYGHTSKTFVKQGQEVQRGTRIAAVGSTGRSTGPHLHYAIQKNGRTVNPADYIFE